MIYLQDINNEKLNIIILKLSISFIKHLNFRKKWFIIKYFDEILEYKLSELYWKCFIEYISMLAILQFYVWILSLEYYLPSKKRDWYIYNLNAISLTIFQDFHSLWLIDEINYSFSYIHKLLNYNMSIFKDIIKENKLWFSNDNYYFYDNQVFEISKWKEMIKNIHRRAKSILNR